MINKKLKLFWNKNFRHSKRFLVEKYLNAGLTYSQVKKLLRLKEDNIEDYVLNNGINYELFSLIGGINSLYFVNQMSQYRKSIKEKIFKNIIYPLILYILICCLLIFFIYLIMPSIYRNLSSLGISLNDFVNKMFLLQIVLVILVASGVLAVIIYFWLSSVKNQKWLFIIFYRSWWFGAFKLWLTLDFIWLYIHFYKLGLNTKQIIEAIYNSSDEYLIKWQATLIRYKLEEGSTLIESLDKRFINNEFILLFELFSYNNDINLLDNFLMVRREYFLSKIVLVLNFVKFVEYLIIGFLVIYLYQILLLPISYLDNIL